MKKCILLFAASLAFCASATPVHISTKNTSLVLDAAEGEPLKTVYYGTRLSAAEAGAIPGSMNLGENTYPAFGLRPQTEAAIAVTHPDGNMTLDLRVEKVDSSAIDKGMKYTVHLRDKVYPFYVDVNFLSPKDADVIETWTEIWHNEKKPVQMRRYESAMLPVRAGDVWASTLHGAWASETRVSETPLDNGMLVIKDTDGVRNAQRAHPEIMLSLDGRPQENSGRVIGAALCWSGNYKIMVDTDVDSRIHRLYAGINSDHGAFPLKKGERFVTPPLALTYSDEGLGGASRNFHRWGRKHKIAGGEQLRDILLNSWEGVYFGVNEEGMDKMISDIADLGGELFVMDDGWFGVKYPRNHDRAGLGDWLVDPKKLPSGLNGLIETARKHGVKFGIWLEPEAVNSKSEFFERHPDYVIKAAKRDTVFGRGNTQLMLDLSNPKVQDAVFTIVDTLLTKYPDIAYIKWDANMPMLEYGSQYLGADSQGSLDVAYHNGLKKVLERIRAKYPDVVMQACASGGGRCSYGVLPWFNEVWTSDNTDAMQRLYMQWGTSYFYPAGVMGAHISASPNHQTGRQLPLKFRIDVAMSGRLGLELQPSAMTDAERDIVRKAIAEYKEIRPVVQQGDLYRLLSPYDHKGATAHMQVSPDKSKAVYFWYRMDTFYHDRQLRIPMAGLDPDAQYKVHEINRTNPHALDYEGKTFSGRFLMQNGLEMRPAPYGALNGNDSSCVLLLEKVN